MQELTITKIYRSTKDKLGNELKTKDGRPYERVAIKTQEYGDKYISGFSGDFNRNWQIGDKVKVLVEQKGEYLNFSKITENDLLELRVAKLEKDVEALRKFIATPANPAEPSELDYPPEEDSNIPF